MYYEIDVPSDVEEVVINYKKSGRIDQKKTIRGENITRSIYISERWDESNSRLGNERERN